MEKWYEHAAQNADVVISTRIRIARNLSGLPFEGKLLPEQQKELVRLVREALERQNSGNTNWRFLDMEKLSRLERKSLLEQRLISQDFVEHPVNRLLAITEDDSLSVLVNDADHIRIQAFAGGMDLTGAYHRCDQLDDYLGSIFTYAFDGQLGYLTAYPTDLGTGLRASVMLHLPALEHAQIVPQLVKTVGRLGLTIRGAYGDGSRISGATYQLENQLTLGLSEETAISNLQNVIEQILSSERNLRKELLKNNIEIIDEICRSYGILKYAQLLSTEEFYERLSSVRFGVAEKILDGVQIETLNTLLTKIGVAALCAEANENLSPMERDFHRAQLVRNAL